MALSLLVWGIILFALGILQMPEAFPWTFAFGRIFRPIQLVNALLYFVWSMIRIWFGTRELRASFQISYKGASR